MKSTALQRSQKNTMEVIEGNGEDPVVHALAKIEDAPPGCSELFSASKIHSLSKLHTQASAVLVATKTLK